MHLVFSDQTLPLTVTKSIFLAGPSPRKRGPGDVPDWRHDALTYLDALGYTGTVFIPAPQAVFFGLPYANDVDYDSQIAWEVKARAMADQLVFWVGRDIDRSREDLGMPGFTTNVELGADQFSGKLVYGRPDDAPKCRYLDECVRAQGYPVHNILSATLNTAVAALGEGSLRIAGETSVPLFIWQSPQFQSWYANLKAAGNILHDAQVRFNLKVGGGKLFSYILAVDIWVTAENRFKSNELVFARRDVSLVLAFYNDPAANTVKVVLVREFRSTVNNKEGYVYELPGGSVLAAAEPMQNVARVELQEETGLSVVDASRLRYVGQRQVAASTTSQVAHVYALQLTAEEIAELERTAASGKPLGEVADSERTFVHVVRIQDLLKLPVDYTTLGVVFEAMATDPAFLGALT